MKRAVKTLIILGGILFLLGMIAACGKSEKKYIGKYISKETVEGTFDRNTGTFKREHQILEIKKDGKYEISPSPGSSSTGEWKIDKDGIVLYEGQTRIPKIIGEIKGNTLIDRFGGKTFIKQD